jgi:hypothetical protein
MRAPRASGISNKKTCDEDRRKEKGEHGIHLVVPPARFLIARIWGDIMIWDARKLARQTHNARKFSQAGSCRDSRLLKNRNTTGFAMEPIRANEGRDDVASRPGAGTSDLRSERPLFA